MRLRVAYPKRGPHPLCPEGYEQEPGDPYSFTKKWPLCVFHGISSCGRHICALKGIMVNQSVCESCADCCSPKSSG